MNQEPIDVLVVGLGNPGEKYAGTRHNMGWVVLDEIHKLGNWTAWEWTGKGLASAGKVQGHSVVMLKPMTMMNLSGEAVVALMTAFPVEASHIIVVHDEMDVGFSEIRTKFGGGAAGHRGVANVQALLGTKDFHRVRCGIGRPAAGVEVIQHVLTSFTTEESESIPGMALAGCQQVHQIIANMFPVTSKE